MRRLLVLPLLLLLLTASPALALGKLHVVVTGENHHPLVGKKWHYEVLVINAKTGKPVACRIHMQFFFGSIAVGEVGVHTVKNGFWQETFGAPGNPTFPAAARGQRLVLTATVTAKGFAKARAGWWVVAR